MDEHSQPRSLTEPKNAVLRGGAFDGEQLAVSAWIEVARESGGVRYVYRPTAEMDEEFPTLRKFVFDRSEPAEL